MKMMSKFSSPRPSSSLTWTRNLAICLAVMQVLLGAVLHSSDNEYLSNAIDITTVLFGTTHSAATTPPPPLPPLGMMTIGHPSSSSPSSPSSPSLPFFDYTESAATIRGDFQVTYRIAPRRFLQFQNDPLAQVLVGVLSHADHQSQRDLVRHTWAHNSGSSVYFIVASDINHENATTIADRQRRAALQAEFATHGDLIWITNLRETYRGVVYKTLVLFHAVTHHLDGGKNDPSFRHVFKTDEDSYVRLGRLEHLSATTHAAHDYWGKCAMKNPVNRQERAKWYVSTADHAGDVYSPYALGAGYALSPTFAKVASALAARRSAPPIVHVEDANTGVLAALVNVTCHLEPSIQAAAPYAGHPQPDAPHHFGVASSSSGQQEFFLKYNTLPMTLMGYHYNTCSLQQQQQQRLEMNVNDERDDDDDYNAAFILEKSCWSSARTDKDDGNDKNRPQQKVVTLPFISVQ